jgi:signal transduction histidine kinase
MKLAWKLVAAIVLAITVVAVVNGYFRIQREVVAFETDMRRDHLALGRPLAFAAAMEWDAHGKQQALQMIAAANELRSSMTVQWVDSASPPAGNDGGTDVRSAIAGGHVAVRIFTSEHGERRLSTFVPIMTGQGVMGAVEVSESLAVQDEFVQSSIVRTVAAAVATVGASALMVIVASVWFVGRPVRLLVAEARRVGTGDLCGRISLRQRDEVGVLADELNRMCEGLSAAQERVEKETAARIATIEQLRHADRLTTVGKLASGVAHELGTPLTVVAGRAKMIASGEATGAQAADNARIVVEQTERMTRIIRQLLDFARRREPRKEPGELGPLVDKTLAMLAPLAKKSSVSLERLGESPAGRARIDASQIQQVLTNVVVNGIQAMPRGGKLTVEIERRQASPPSGTPGRPGEHFCVRVSDAGAGIPPDVLPHIFDPFFTTKDVGEGTGLGLAVSFGIMREHEGWIEVESEVGKGSRFGLWLPVEVEG